MFKKTFLAVAICAASLIVAAAAPADEVLYDQPLLFGDNGYSNGVVEAFGERRTVLDDFVIPDGQIWQITEFQWTNIWNTVAPGSGTGVELEFFADAGGAPLGASQGTASVNSYTELGTGEVFFGRAAARSTATFDAITLGPGTYWFEATIVGPENNFWMVDTANSTGIIGSEAWVNFANPDVGLVPGSSQFGAAANANFQLGGTVVPEPTSLGILALTSLVILRRRRS